MKSQKERGYLWANKPDIARKFEAETPKGAKLPLRVGRGSASEVKPWGTKGDRR